MAPVFHHLVSVQNKIKLPVCFLNLGGISNITIVKDKNNLSKLASRDIGPGNCLIDNWVRKIQKIRSRWTRASGQRNEIILSKLKSYTIIEIIKKKCHLIQMILMYLSSEA